MPHPIFAKLKNQFDFGVIWWLCDLVAFIFFPDIIPLL